MGFEACDLRQTDDEIARLSLAHLEHVVRVDSQSNEHSDSIPSTPGQQELADDVARFFEDCGGTVERDAHANVVASFPGRGAGAQSEPLALLVHLDTSRGTIAVPRLQVLQAWDGTPIPYPENGALCVAQDTYPATTAFLGQDIVHGPGRAPFGLDDKLGLAHLMTLATLLASNPAIPHPPLLLVGRPDEEIGRMRAVEGLAQLLAARGVRFGYTVDGIVPFEINVENFNASNVRVRFGHEKPHEPRDHARRVVATLNGVNTHGATAHAERHRNATRLAVETWARLAAHGQASSSVFPLEFATDTYRECDATWSLLLQPSNGTSVDDAHAALTAALDDVIAPHTARGASWRLGTPEPLEVAQPLRTTLHVLGFLESFIASDPGFVLLAEDSFDRHGYTHPYRVTPVDDGVHMDFRVRDFSMQSLEAREEHVRGLASQHGATSVEVTRQYVNMGPRLQPHRELVEWATQSADALGIEARVQPIRGGTGVDPFLDRGVAIANLGTGYFAPESEKEFTSLQMMARHARWLTTLVQGIVTS